MSHKSPTPHKTDNISDANNVNNNLLVQWLRTLKTANRSAHTLNAYERDVHQLITFLVTEETSLLAFTRHLLQEYVSTRLEQDDISATSVQRELSSIRQFYSWLMQHKHINSNPLVGFKIKSIPRKLPEMVDIDMLTRLLDQPPPEPTKRIPSAETTARWYRDKAMLELLYSAGLRVAELIDLNLTDIDVNTKQLIVQSGKGNKTRMVPIGSKAITALNAWLVQRSSWLDSTAEIHAVFINKPTKTKLASRLSTRTVQRRIQYHAQRAGIDKRMYPHLLRHCFASHMLSGSGNLRAVQELLGHANISTTQIYTHLDFEKLSQVYDANHPRAKKNKC